MPPLSLSQAFILYGWFPLAALLFFLLLIARAYQRFSGHNTHFRLYLLPIALFGAAAVRAANSTSPQSDTVADLLLALGGLLLLGLTGLLYQRMIAGRAPLKPPQ